MKTIGFVGTGVMGAAMARNLLEAGYRVTVTNRTLEKVRPLEAAGARVAPSVAEAVRDADVAISIVGFPDDVRDVYLGEAGLLASLPRGAIAIDMTTSEPRLARELAAAGAERDVAVLDAPVSGGDVGARDGTLSIMVGGPDEAFQAVRPVLEVLGKRIVHQGPSGAGQHTKMANQIAIASTMIGAMEALRYAEAAGLDPSRVLESIGAGAAGSWTLSNLYPRVVAGDFAPGFYVRHFMKDLDIAADEATDMTLDLQGLDLARRMYRALMDAGHGDEGTQALYKALVE